MSVITYTKNTKLSPHFHSYEFKCPECRKVKLSTELIKKTEELISKANARECVVSSGYRSPEYDTKINGLPGRHSEGLAMDVCFYDQTGKIIPSDIICNIAYELKFPGIIRIDENFVHLDVRSNGTYYGDESKENNNN